MPSRLRVLSEPQALCRTVGCDFRATGPLGFCGPCEAVHHAARELREAVLARRGRDLRARHRALFDALSPPVRDRLLAHIAAQAPGRPGWLGAGLEDFFGELRELGLTRDELT